MKLNVMHVRIGTANVALFEADARIRTTHDRQQLLNRLTAQARAANLRVERSALVFVENGRRMTFGDADLVRYLSRNHVVLNWTHTLTV